jgi:putative ABC transport system permease protein
VSPELNEEAQRQISDVLRIRRHLPSNKPNNFVVFTDDAFLQIFTNVRVAIFFVTLLISSISLVVGSIGVMNIMLVSVIERTREIGIRKALGAPRRVILGQFLVEAVVLTAAGGVLGILLGAGISWLVKTIGHLPSYVPFWSAAGALAVSAAVGLFFGLYPAMRASRLDPVESLRYE